MVDRIVITNRLTTRSAPRPPRSLGNYVGGDGRRQYALCAPDMARVLRRAAGESMRDVLPPVGPEVATSRSATYRPVIPAIPPIADVGEAKVCFLDLRRLEHPAGIWKGNFSEFGFSRHGSIL